MSITTSGRLYEGKKTTVSLCLCEDQKSRFDTPCERRNTDVEKCTIHLSKNTYLLLANRSDKHWLSLFIKLTSCGWQRIYHLSLHLPNKKNACFLSGKGLRITTNHSSSTSIIFIDHTDVFESIRELFEGLKTNTGFRASGMMIFFLFGCDSSSLTIKAK